MFIAVDTSVEKADELDRALMQLEDAVDIAMQVGKGWAVCGHHAFDSV